LRRDHLGGSQTGYSRSDKNSTVKLFHSNEPSGRDLC
jgi:hypothetical protein